MSLKKGSNIKALMPALKNKKYFNYGGQGPLPMPSLQAITASWEAIQELGPFTNNVWPYISSEIKETKQYLAKLCGVKSSQIALTENVTSGCVLPLLGLPFSSGDHLLISDCEHPGIVSACKELARNKQLNIDILPVQQLRNGRDGLEATKHSLLENLESGLRPKTRLVVLSHLLWNTGQIMSISSVVERLSKHKNRPFLLVDAAQSFEQIPIKEAAKKADIYAFTGHKWACGPEGLGAVALSERILEESKPTLVGWRSLQHEGPTDTNEDIPFHIDSRRFEVATSCIPLLAGLRCSLDLIEKEGTTIDRLERIKKWSFQLWIELNKIKKVNTLLKGPPPGGIVSFSLPQKNGSPQEIVKQLGRKGLWIRSLEDPVCLRACVHFMSEENEIKELITAIESI